MRLVGLDPNGTFQTLFTTPRSGVPREVVRLLKQLQRHGLSLVAAGGYNYRCCIGVNCFQTDLQLWCNTINTGAPNQECSKVSNPC